MECYLPEGVRTHLLTGETVEGGRRLREHHGFDSLPLYVRPGAVVPLGADDQPSVPTATGPKASPRSREPTSGTRR